MYNHSWCYYLGHPFCGLSKRNIWRIFSENMYFCLFCLSNIASRYQFVIYNLLGDLTARDLCFVGPCCRNVSLFPDVSSYSGDLEHHHKSFFQITSTIIWTLRLVKDWMWTWKKHLAAEQINRIERCYTVGRPSVGLSQRLLVCYMCTKIWIIGAFKKMVFLPPRCAL